MEDRIDQVLEDYWASVSGDAVGLGSGWTHDPAAAPVCWRCDRDSEVDGLGLCQPCRCAVDAPALRTNAAGRIPLPPGDLLQAAIGAASAGAAFERAFAAALHPVAPPTPPSRDWLAPTYMEVDGVVFNVVDADEGRITLSNRDAVTVSFDPQPPRQYAREVWVSGRQHGRSEALARFVSVVPDLQQSMWSFFEAAREAAREVAGTVETLDLGEATIRERDRQRSREVAYWRGRGNFRGRPPLPRTPPVQRR